MTKLAKPLAALFALSTLCAALVCGLGAGADASETRVAGIESEEDIPVRVAGIESEEDIPLYA